MKSPNQAQNNPLSDLISDEIYELLDSRGLINEKSVRASDAIDQLREDYPYLQFDTIRKIVYQLQK